MKLWIKSTPRKDGKHNVTYGFNNGARYKKLRTREQIINELQSGFDMIIEGKDWDNTIRKAMGCTLFYEF